MTMVNRMTQCHHYHHYQHCKTWLWHIEGHKILYAIERNTLSAHTQHYCCCLFNWPSLLLLVQLTQFPELQQLRV